MAMSDYLENALLDAVVNNTSFTSPANVYVALYSTAPTESTSGTELTGNGYARQEITFSAAVTGVATSDAVITFPTATSDWLTVVGVAIVDSATAGNILFYKNTAGRNIKSGDTLNIDSGDITITLD